MQIIITLTGSIRCVYDEAIDLVALGRPEIRRGSHVEPDEQGRWIADMGVVDGPVLGPFALRSEALEAERAWLEQHWLIQTDPPI